MSFAPIRNAFHEWTSQGSEFSAGWKHGGDWSRLTPLLIMDLVESDKDYQIVCDAPGVEPDELNVTLHEYAITITADRKNTYSTSVDKIHLMERTYGNISRRVQVPRNADIERNTTTFKNGVLRIVFPKTSTEGSTEGKKLDITHE